VRLIVQFDPEESPETRAILFNDREEVIAEVYGDRDVVAEGAKAMLERFIETTRYGGRP
jgi:hypothetical protein